MVQQFPKRFLDNLPGHRVRLIAPMRLASRTARLLLFLPQDSYRDPRIFVSSIDLIAEVSLGGRRIYSFGSFDERGRGRLSGWPWHLISLPEDFGAKELGRNRIVTQAQTFPRLVDRAT